MAELRMTANRLALLRAIADPNVTVYRCRDFASGDVMSVWNLADHSERLVTSRCRELETAKLIATGPASGPSWYSRRNWEITDAGRQVLADTKENGS